MKKDEKKEEKDTQEETLETVKENVKPAQDIANESNGESAKEEKDDVEEKAKENKEVDELAQLKAENEELKKQIEELTKKQTVLKNEYAKAYADTENMKKRLNSEFESFMKYHIQSFANEILPVLDNCERALAIKPKDSEDENYRKAFEMVLKQLKTALQKEGVEEIDCNEKEYDANTMQALMSEKVEGKQANQVIEVLQKGYQLKDRLLRAAMVKVSE